MRYRIKYLKGDTVIRTTGLNWPTFDAARFFLERIMKWTYSNEFKGWIKHGDERAEIVCENGIPF